jgi:hypothetical protein
MSTRFHVGDRGRWNSGAGMASGHLTARHTKDIQYKGHTRHCSGDDPRYEIESIRIDHVAMHKSQALKRV